MGFVFTKRKTYIDRKEVNAIEVLYLTNNPILSEDEVENGQRIFVEGEFLDVLHKARDLVHAGHRLISHPIGASIRMMYSPYRSILLSKEAGSLDEYSASVIESSIENYRTTMGIRNIDYKNAKDYAQVDHALFKAALKEMALLEAGQ